MTTNEIKFKLKKYLPDFIFSTVYSIWFQIIKPTIELYNKRILKSFKREAVGEVICDGINFKIKINPSNGTLDREIFLNNVYEPFFLKLIKNNLSEGGVFVDIGANIGQHSLFASKVVGNSGKVISFEPIKKLYQQFKESIELNSISNITVHNLACGNEVKNMTINISPLNIGASSLVRSYLDGESEQISIVTADSILETEPRVDFLKIDVEGFEYNTLLGLQQTIAKFKPKILLEFSPYYYKDNSPIDSLKIFDLLTESGYDVYDLENNNKPVSHEYITQILEQNIPQTNFLATARK